MDSIWKFLLYKDARSKNVRQLQLLSTLNWSWKYLNEVSQCQPETVDELKKITGFFETNSTSLVESKNFNHAKFNHLRVRFFGTIRIRINDPISLKSWIFVQSRLINSFRRSTIRVILVQFKLLLCHATLGSALSESSFRSVTEMKLPDAKTRAVT